MEIIYTCEDCGEKFTARKKKKILKCKKCETKWRNCVARGKEYVPENATQVAQKQVEQKVIGIIKDEQTSRNEMIATAKMFAIFS